MLIGIGGIVLLILIIATAIAVAPYILPTIGGALSFVFALASIAISEWDTILAGAAGLVIALGLAATAAGATKYIDDSLAGWRQKYFPDGLSRWGWVLLIGVGLVLFVLLVAVLGPAQ